MAAKFQVRRLGAHPVGPFRVDEVEITLPREGKPALTQRRVCFERGDSACVLLRRLDKDVVVLARQFRYPVYARTEDEQGSWILELPAGVLQPGEAAEASAQRELLEETGYEVRAFDRLHSYFVSPGGTSERMFTFYAEVVGDPTGPGGGVEAEGELIEVVEMSTKQFTAAALAGELIDGKTLYAGLWLAQRLAEEAAG